MDNVTLSPIPRFNVEKEMVELVDVDGNVIVELNRDLVVAIVKLVAALAKQDQLESESNLSLNGSKLN